ASSRVMAASTCSGGKLSMSRVRLIANPLSVGRCEQRRCCARLDHALVQRRQKLADLVVVPGGDNVLENKPFRQHAPSRSQIFPRLFFVERLKRLLPFAHGGSGRRRLAPMAQNIFEDLSRKPVARALRPAPTMT